MPPPTGTPPFRSYIILFVNGGGVGTGGRAGGGVDTPHCTGAPAPNGPLVSFRRFSHLAGCNLAAGCATARQMSHPARPGGHDSDDSRIWLAAVWLLAVQLRHYGKQGFQGRHKPTATKCETSLRFQKSRLSVRCRGFASPAAAYQDGAQRFPHLRKWAHTPVAVRGSRPPYNEARYWAPFR